MLSQFWFPSAPIVQSFCCVRFLASAWTAAHQASHPSPSPEACSNSCHVESVIPSNQLILCRLLLLLPSNFPASGSFPMSWLFASGGQSTGASALASILPMNIQGRFPLGLASLISLLSKELSRVFSVEYRTTVLYSMDLISLN